MARHGSSLDLDRTVETTHELMSEELVSWASQSAVVALFFGVLLTPISLPASLIIALSVVLIYTSARILKTLTEWRKLDLSNYVSSVSHLSLQSGAWLCLLMQILHWSVKLWSFTVTVLPPALAACLYGLFLKRMSLSCVGGVQYITYALVTCSLVLPGLKFDGILEATWFNCLWPVWIFLAVLFTLSIGTVIALLASIARVCSRETDYHNLVVSLWLCVSTLGPALAYGYFFVQVVYSKSPVTIHCWALCVFHLLFTITTCVYQRYFARWGTEEEEQEGELSERVEHRSVGRRVVDFVEKVPQKLLKVSGTYFKPVKESSLSNRPASTDGHKKSTSQASMPVLETGNDDSQDECGVCRSQWSNVVIQPCGHSGLCFSCGINLKEQGSTCHICRSPITALLKVDTRGHEVFKVRKRVNFS